MRKFVRPSMVFVLVYSGFLTFALWGWHELLTVMPDPLGLFTKPDIQWLGETYFGVTFCLTINLMQMNKNLIERLLWGALFSASGAMLYLILQSGWQGALVNFLMRLPIVGEGIKSQMIIAYIPKIIETNVIVLAFGKISGLIEIDIPKSQLLSGPIHPFDDGWRQY